MHRQGRLGEAVVRELPFTRDVDQAGAVKVAEVPGDGGLRQDQQADQVADAELAGDEKIQDANPRGVREASKKEIEVSQGVGGGRCHRALSQSCRRVQSC